MGAILLALALTAQAEPPESRNALRNAEPVLREMLAEARDGHYHRGSDGTIFVAFSTRPRATGFAGVCESERVLMQMMPPAHGVAAVRRPRLRQFTIVEEYHVLRRGEAPSLLAGGPLADACAASAARDGSALIETDSPLAAQVAVLGMIAVREALRRPESPLVEISCYTADCADRAALARRIDPWTRYHVQRETCDDPQTYSCLLISLRDDRLCGSWQLRLESAWGAPERMRAVRFVEIPDAMRHCTGGTN